MSKSRQELLAWVNELLQTNYTKVEQLGSGAAYCQILDSIYNDVPLRRVKFNANQEYEYINNFKILHNTFSAHNIDRPVDAARLTKLKFQDNFEFLQWLRSFWEQEYSGEHYDAVARRKAQPVNANGFASPRPASSASSAKVSARGSSRTGYVRPTAHPINHPTTTATRAGSSASRPSTNNATQSAALAEANSQIVELKGLLSTSEEERGYYYDKLRAVEAFLQQYETHSSPETSKIIKELQDVLYNDDAPEFSPELEPENINYETLHSKISNMTINEEETF